MPGARGSKGCVRSSAWIWLFWSTHSTMAINGGSKYSPTMSPTFSTNSGSLERLKVSCRCGCSPKARQIRDTAVCDRPASRAIERVLQCVAVSGTLSSVLAITASTRASSIVRGAPGRGASSSPSSRCSTNRARYFDTVCGVTRCRLATTLLSMPEAQARTMRARSANACDVFRRRVSAVSGSCSPWLNTSSALGLPRIAASSCPHGTRSAQYPLDSSTDF
jgi:hypothetical protein